MTILFSAVSFIGRFAGALLTTALGWASSLLFGRVPRSHQIFLVLMLSGSVLWVFLIVAALLPQIPGFLVDTTPHPSFDRSWLYPAIIGGILLVPFGVGVAGYLVPADGDRPTGPAALGEALRGYLLAPVLAALLVFLAAVGITRKVRSVRRGWSDTHIPIVVKPDGYDRLVQDLQEVFSEAGLPVEARDAPAVLSIPAWLLTRIAGPNVRKLRPDRLIELRNLSLRIGVYPSDLAISGPTHERTKARAAVLSGLTTSAAYLTTSAEAQAIEDRLERLGPRREMAARRRDPSSRPDLPRSTRRYRTLRSRRRNGTSSIRLRGRARPVAGLCPVRRGRANDHRAQASATRRGWESEAQAAGHWTLRSAAGWTRSRDRSRSGDWPTAHRRVRPARRPRGLGRTLPHGTGTGAWHPTRSIPPGIRRACRPHRRRRRSHRSVGRRCRGLARRGRGIEGI